MNRQNLIIALVIILFTNCEYSKIEDNLVNIFDRTETETTIEMNGVISGRSFDDFNQLLSESPNIIQINILNCNGSFCNKTKLKLSKLVHNKGLHTHLSDNSEITSGGVDFFLSGKKRTIGKNIKIGVNSWSKNSTTAIDFAVGHTKHLEHIDFYTTIGFTQKQAESFYYFGINAAPPGDIHWMTDKEIKEYNILTK